MSTETDVFQHAAESQAVANEAYIAAKTRMAEIDALRGETSSMDRFREIAAHAMPLIKRFAPLIAGAGGLGAIASDPSLMANILGQFASMFGTGS